MTAELGFVGLGTMGQPMAENLVAAGRELVVWNRSPKPAEALGAAGATVAPSIDALFEETEIVLLMLADADAVDAVLGRGGARFSERCRDRTIVPMSTTTGGYSERLAAEVESAGGRYVEAPVSGSRIPAERGELLVFLAGESDDLDRIEPTLAPLGRTVRCGPVGSGQRLKHATNLVLSPALLGLAEGMAFARHAGLDLELFARVLLGSQFSSDILRAKVPKMLAEDYTVQGAIRSAVDSLDQTVETAEEIGFDPELQRRCLDLLRRAIDAGLAEEDIVAVEKVLGGGLPSL